MYRSEHEFFDGREFGDFVRLAESRGFQIRHRGVGVAPAIHDAKGEQVAHYSPLTHKLSIYDSRGVELETIVGEYLASKRTASAVDSSTSEKSE